MGWGTSWVTEDTTPIILEIIKEKEHTNKVPTHDPYTNPDTQIYFQCGCGSILDPGTKSFASLCGSAAKTGWKIRFITGRDYYTAFCIDCGKDVE